jgi:hypothetical protein
MTARSADAGRKMKCPDCGRANVIPLPPKPQPKVQPAALEGEQLELWDVDARTWEPGFMERATLHPVECRVCQTLMYATDEQIGSEMKCPDCGVLTVAKLTEPQKPKRPRRALRGPEYELDPASAPAPRPMVTPIAIRDAELHEHARATTVGPDGRLIVQRPNREVRPERPAMPVVMGVSPMLFRGEVLAHGTLLSLWLSGVIWLGSQLVAAGMGGMAAIAGLCLFTAALILGLIWLTVAAPIWVAIVTESSEGHDRLQTPPNWFAFEWFGDTLTFAIAAAASLIPSWFAAKGIDLALRASSDGASGLSLVAIGGVTAVGWLVCFPILLLSSLDQGSPLDVFSPRVLGSLVRGFVPWLAFYVVSTLWLAGFGYIGGKAATAPGSLWTVPFIMVAASILYMRFLGRLAWWLADALPVADDDEGDTDDAAAAHPHLAAALAAKRAEAKAAAAASHAK